MTPTFAIIPRTGISYRAKSKLFPHITKLASSYSEEDCVITHLKAQYIDTEPEPGYQAGQTYFLEVHQHWFGKITIRPTHGYRFKPLSDMRLVYRSLESFLGSWRVLHVVDTVEY